MQCGYPALMAAAGPALRCGRSVVIYPEGTRSADGMISQFRTGAVRLARDCGVPVVPVALLGTRDVLPKNGRFRPTPMRVRLGEPLDPGSLTGAALREHVVALRESRVAVR